MRVKLTVRVFVRVCVCVCLRAHACVLRRARRVFYKEPNLEGGAKEYCEYSFVLV